jgi:hypothetical protein
MSEEITKTAQAIEEVAKTSGKAIDSIQNFCSFIAKFTEGSVREACGIFEDKLRYARWQNQLNLMLKAERFLQEKNLQSRIHPLPFKLAVPLLQAASLEDDPYLQEMWAKLLVNSVSGVTKFELQRVYIDILERLAPYDAHILEIIYSIPYEQCLHKAIITTHLPSHIEVEKDENNAPSPSEEACFSLLNLDRLNCIAITRSMGGGQIFSMVNQTLLGRGFIDACA